MAAALVVVLRETRGQPDVLVDRPADVGDSVSTSAVDGEAQFVNLPLHGIGGDLGADVTGELPPHWMSFTTPCSTPACSRPDVRRPHRAGYVDSTGARHTTGRPARTRREPSGAPAPRPPPVRSAREQEAPRGGGGRQRRDDTGTLDDTGARGDPG